MTYKVNKDPAEVLDYTIDYSPVLNAATPVDTIATSNWRIDGNAWDMVIANESNTTLIATVWLSGGTRLGARHKVVNTITTAGGRTYERTITVTARDK